MSSSSQEAFPEEAARFAWSGNLDDLINDDTIGRAVATFLRTVVTRNTLCGYEV